MGGGGGLYLLLMRISHCLKDYIGGWLVIGCMPSTYRGGTGDKNGKPLTVAGGWIPNLSPFVCYPMNLMTPNYTIT